MDTDNLTPQNQPKIMGWIWWVMGIITVIFFIILASANSKNQIPLSPVDISDNNQNTSPTNILDITNNIDKSSSASDDTNASNAANNQPVVPEEKCVHSNVFSATEMSRINGIVSNVMQGGTNIPINDLHDELWSIFGWHGKLCEEDIMATMNNFTAASQCSMIFYQDALISLHNGQAFKSSERQDCEDKTIIALLPKDKAGARINANENLMRNIAAQQPIQTASGDIVFTEEIIQSTIDNMSAKLRMVYKLFTPPSL